MKKTENTFITVRDAGNNTFTVRGDIAVEKNPDSVVYFVMPVTAVEGKPLNDSFGQVSVTLGDGEPKCYKSGQVTRSPWDFTLKCLL